MKVALIVSEFPSREHPYIWDWTRSLLQEGIDLHIFTEKSSSHSALYFTDLRL